MHRLHQIYRAYSSSSSSRSRSLLFHTRLMQGTLQKSVCSVGGECGFLYQEPGEFIAWIFKWCRPTSDQLASLLHRYHELETPAVNGSRQRCKNNILDHIWAELLALIIRCRKNVRRGSVFLSAQLNEWLLHLICAQGFLSSLCLFVGGCAPSSDLDTVIDVIICYNFWRYDQHHNACFIEYLSFRINIYFN